MTFVGKYYRWFAMAVLGLAVFNLTFRLDREFVTEWDESLYAISAWEALVRGSWIGTTFLGALDYYNTKPPLLVWMIALSFKAFGVTLTSLRLASVTSAWLTVAVLQHWAKRCFGPLVALLSSLVLSMTFGFIHVHSGRSAATDAPFTLVLLLTVVTLWAEVDRPRRRAWLGPLFAAAFLLRGMAVLMPMSLMAIVDVIRMRSLRTWWRTTLPAAALFLLPVTTWVVLRYQVDGWRFLQHLFMYDFVTRTLSPIEGHPGSPFFFLNILQKDHYNLIIAGAAGWLAFPFGWRQMRRLLVTWRTQDEMVLLAAWAAVTLVIPTVMQTKMPWYLNTFYPAFAVGIGLSLARGVRTAANLHALRWRPVAFFALSALGLAAAESRLMWYSVHNRDLGLSRQSLVLAEGDQLRGHRLYLPPLARGVHFVAEAIVGAEPQHVADYPTFLRESREGDYLVTSDPCTGPGVAVVRSNGTHFLCRRQDRVLDSVRESSQR